IPEPAPFPPLAPITGPIWILAGSQHPATRAQMKALPGVTDHRVERLEAHEPDFARRLGGLEECATQGLCLPPSPPPYLTPSFTADVIPLSRSPPFNFSATPDGCA